MKKIKFEDLFYHDVSILEIKISHIDTNSDKQLLFLLENENNKKIKCCIERVYAISIESHFKVDSINSILEVTKIEDDEWVSNEINAIKQFPNVNNDLFKSLMLYKLVTSHGEVFKLILESEYVLYEEYN